jgi:hypothetical protein
MTLWGAIAGGVIGTVVLTTSLRGAQELGWTRMDLPFLLGTVFTGNRGAANILGYGLHFVNGLLFSLAYYGIFAAVGRAGWIFGAALGLVHGAFAGSALVTILLPAVHPRMASRWADAEETPLLEPPGFMLRNYGERTVLGNLLAHIAYGAIVGGFAARLHLY